MTVSRPRALIGLGGAAALFLSACSGSDDASERTPTQVLAEAKQNLDATPGVHVVLSTEKLPEGVDGILSTDGIGTHPPAFEGDLKVSVQGITSDAAVVAVDDVVYAKLPFTTQFVPVNPEDYGAPDPADLLAEEGGLSSLLSEAEDVEAGGEIRNNKSVVTEYTGTVPGDAVATIIPSAAADSDFDATFTITEEDVLDEAVISGPFYPDAGDVSYTITFDDYGTDKQITAP
ncbi:MAG: LppX_LprAFG lipoprotein [Actinomycetota bacterium]|nr:LppX_LprAFG lipoprotein [Actinomycetota bacterium]